MVLLTTYVPGGNQTVPPAGAAAIAAWIARVKLGGFDPLLGVGSQGRGGEDLDMFLRATAYGPVVRGT